LGPIPLIRALQAFELAHTETQLGGRLAQCEVFLDDSVNYFDATDFSIAHL
jgi:hypothetical protein